MCERAFTRLHLIFPPLNQLSLSNFLIPKISVFYIYRPPSSPTFSNPFSVLMNLILSSPRLFIITGAFNIHLHNVTDHATSEFLFPLSSFNLTQHINFPSHIQNHILDLIITFYRLLSLASSLSLLPTAVYPTTSRFSLNFHCLLRRFTHSAVFTP